MRGEWEENNRMVREWNVNGMRTIKDSEENERRMEGDI
jgi:hypothetical protein